MAVLRLTACLALGVILPSSGTRFGYQQSGWHGN